MKKTTKFIFVAALSCIALSAGILGGCTSKLGEHTSTYFSGINKVFEDAAEYNRIVAEVENGTKNENALDKPANFTIDENGKYSFDKVENAASYEISVYETQGTLTATATKTITAGDAATYTGNVSEISADLSYGEWYVRVVAVPAENSELEESGAAMATYIKRGAVTNGTITTTYIWNACTGDMTLNLNGLDYRATAYPTNIAVTLKNTSTNATYTAETGKVSSSSASIDLELPKSDATYSIALDCTWDETYVTNPSWSTTASNISVLGKESSISDGLSYSSGIFNSFDFPLVYEGFAVDNVPTNKTYAEVAFDDGVEFGKYGNDVSFKAFPLWTEKGYTAKTNAVKSFDVRIKGSDSIKATPKKSPGSSSTNMIFGQLDFYADGTFELELEYQYIKTDGMNACVYYVPGIICDGIYIVNNDGTYTLSFDYANAEETDYDPVEELNGRASYYSEVDATWSSSGNNNQGGGDQGGGGGGGTDWTITAPSDPTTFDKGATSISLTFGSLAVFSGTLAATPSDGSTYTYNTALTDTNAPFVSTSTLELKSDGTAVWTLPASAGPLSATTLTGTWTETDGKIVITWSK